ncbi:MAG: SbcC/MukB-like Walker B domain-containing protein [Luteolibacter sp.]|uniref:SbcC/MukB-like Walker B domain-containing protein n=1 Tax=Luteolibacter sp. TaxID=1962973 RepID=UPI0032662B35
MSRAIRLTKIHALNWYGYRDSLPVVGNLVLAGVTGSGKSILMDLLMLVLVGPERARHHFNRSATGSKSDRTIKGYCLLDTKREENGQPQYFHDKGVTTYIAAEFTWPDGKRKETWGLRFEFRNTSENDGFTTPFYCPASLEREDFLAISPEDGKQRTRTLADFKSLIDSKGGRLFTTSREYLRDMANPSHLNFNKDVLERLLPSAMSFTNLKSFDDFCRQFVLPAESVPVEDVTSSFRNFESYERELRELRSQLDQLLRIRGLSKTLKEAERDRDVATYLAAEHAWEHAAADVASMESRLTKLREDFAEDEARLAELTSLSTETQRQRERSIALLNESTEGRLYKDLADRIRKLEIEIERLRALASKIDGGLAHRLKAARKWMQDVGKAPVHPFVDVSRMDESLRFLDSCERSETSNSLAFLATAADQLCKQLRDRFRNDAEELRRLRSEKSDLDSQIDALKRGLPPVPQPLLAALRENLPTLPGEVPPRALRELCEVEDEAWRAAAEVAFEEKFAVLVASGHHAQALDILSRLPAADLLKAGPQRVIDSGKIPAASKSRRLKNSLAEVIRCSDETAQGYVDSLFGETIRVSTPADFSRHDSAILPDGLHKRGSVITRPQPYDGQPFIGEGGLKRQLEIKLARLGEIDAALRRLEPIEREIERLIAARQQEIPDHSDISRELVRVEELPNKQSEHEDLMSQLNAIATDEIATLEGRIEEFKEQLAAWDREKNAILRKGGHKDIEQAEKMLESRQKEASGREDDFSRAKLRIDISAHLERYRSWKQEAAEYTPALDVRAREFTKAAAAAEILAANTIGDLKVAMLDFKKTFQPKFDDLPDDGRDTQPYERVLGLIEDANIPEYEKKSATERKRWESLFRTQVLSRMQQAIKNVENIISLLNHQLKRPIGHDRYKIDRKLNPEFRIYRELIDLNALHHEDELFFASMGEDLKEALKTFLTTLVKNANSPDAARLLDYRQYFDYDLLVTDIRDPDGKPVSVDKQSGKMSGGENQSPYFVAILASYLHAYNRHETRRKEPSLALVPIDEAFSKLSGERIQNCLQAMAELDLQGMFSMSSGNIPYAFSQCDELIVITRKEERRGSRVGVRNVPSVLFRDTPEGRKWMDDHAS